MTEKQLSKLSFKMDITGDKIYLAEAKPIENGFSKIIGDKKDITKDCLRATFQFIRENGSIKNNKGEELILQKCEIECDIELKGSASGE